MTHDTEIRGDVREFWNSRAGLGQWAGTRDVLAKQLEIDAIASHVRNGMRILEVGCGNGITAIELARRFSVDVTGIDFAEEMIAAATSMAHGHDLQGAVSFRTGDVTKLPEFDQGFDLIYTERVLINLPDWESQRAAIANITAMLAPGTAYVMCENSQDGLDKINTLRQRVQLPRIDPPWHNRYFRDAELAQLTLADVTLEAVDHYSSTYYLLSRVVNAALAAKTGQEPDYDSEINRLALSLPAIGEYGQGRIWLWRKHSR
jgi:ubiquinone/menaquinone biosynthesis C-methylase UbiE